MTDDAKQAAQSVVGVYCCCRLTTSDTFWKEERYINLQDTSKPYAFFWVNSPASRFNTFLKLSHSSYLPTYEDGTECSETSAYKIQTPGELPRKKAYNIQNTAKIWNQEYLKVFQVLCDKVLFFQHYLLSNMCVSVIYYLLYLFNLDIYLGKLTLISFKNIYRCTVHSVEYLFTHTNKCIYIYILFKKSKIYIKTLKTLLHVSIIRSSSGNIHCSLPKL